MYVKQNDFINGKNNLQKLTFLLLIFKAIVLFSSCVSSSPYDPKIPAKNRCLLELDSRLSTTASRDGLWGADKIIITAGKQDLGFDFETIEELSVTYKKVSKAYNVPLSYDFEAGHHYRILPEIFSENNEKYVRLVVEDLGTNTPVFHNGVYTGVHTTMELHLGSGGLSYAMAGLGFGGDVIIHNGPIRFDLSLAGVGDFGVGPGGTIKDGGAEDSSPICFPLGISGMGMGTFYIPFTLFSIGAGYGYRVEVPVLASNYDSFYSPFIRGELKYKSYGLYFEYYNDPQYLSLFGSTPNRDFTIFKKWGVGLFSRTN